MTLWEKKQLKHKEGKNTLMKKNTVVLNYLKQLLSVVYSYNGAILYIFQDNTTFTV